MRVPRRLRLRLVLLAIGGICLWPVGESPSRALGEPSDPTPRPRSPRRPSFPPKPREPAPPKPKTPEPNTKPEPKKSTPSPEMALPQPRREASPPLNVADRTACFRELAALATQTGASSIRWGEPAVGWAPYPLPEIALERVVRLDRLMTSPIDSVRTATMVVRAIVFDNWAVNKFEERYGYTYDSRQTDYSARLRSQLGAIAANIVDYERPRSEIAYYTDSTGNLRQTEVVRDTDYSLSEDANKKHRELVTQLEADTIDRVRVSRAANTARELLSEELLRVWKSKIEPELGLENAAATRVNLPEHVSGAVFVDSLGAQGNLLTDDVFVYLKAEEPIDDAYIEVRVDDEFSGTVANRYFFDTLNVGTHRLRVFGTHSNWLGQSFKSRYTIRMRSATGMFDAKDVAFPPAGFITNQELTIPEATRRTMRSDLAAAYPQAVDDARAILKIARERFGQPANPEVARTLLTERVRTGVTYLTHLRIDERNLDIRLVLDSFDKDSGLSVGRMEFRSSVGEPQVEPVRGRFFEEASRGCVLGLQTFRDRPLPEDETPRLDINSPRFKRLNEEQRKALIERSKRAAETKRLADEARRSGAAERWRKGTMWCLTDPVEIGLFDRDPIRPDAMVGAYLGKRDDHMYGLYVRFAKSLRARPVEFALFLDSTGKLRMQSPPDEAQVVRSAAVEIEGAKP